MSQPCNMPISEELLEAIKNWIQINCTPEEIFTQAQLEEWADLNDLAQKQFKE